ncbi:hypothetical protein [Rariglobus hedericola]|uniref:Uncharacterized protein n=1 Tax=Rariglobus hedericola TaxID=2597822 RepID=A0A556QCX5_9BACT|nr:hypothetical protein [Rariglobus hedericola]TSJ74494.1 hypothetical protein FPL22_17565 [Rariglobus hedericola]
MKNITLLVFVLACASAFGAENTRDLPLPKKPTSFDFAEVANQFISLGEKEAVAKLLYLCKDSKSEYGHDIDSKTREQIGWICRLVFRAKANSALRPPRFGGLNLPFNTMKYSDWPIYPLAESNGVYFLLADGYSLAGVAEDPRKYIIYCQAEGIFRTDYLIVPSEADAGSALDLLLQKEVWMKIKWKDSEWHTGGGGFSYTLHEESVIKYLRKQTKKANQALQTTTTAVTDRAVARSAPAAVVSDL